MAAAIAARVADDVGEEVVTVSLWQQWVPGATANPSLLARFHNSGLCGPHWPKRHRIDPACPQTPELRK
jgi:hypothetical protein